MAISNQSQFAEPAAIARVLWKSRWLIACMTICGTALGVTYAMLVESWYRAEVSMLVVDRSGALSGSQMLGQLGGLAALAGVNVGGRGDVEPIAVLKSREFARRYIEDEGIADILLSGRKERQGGAADSRRALDFFDKAVRTVVSDRTDGLVLLRIDWTDAELAARWANDLAERINFELRQRALNESQRRIEFLRKEMSDTKEIGVQQTIGALLESEMEKQMGARGDEEFAFRIIDPAEVPIYRLRPRRTLISLAAGALASLLGGVIAVVLAVKRGKLTISLRSPVGAE